MLILVRYGFVKRLRRHGLSTDSSFRFERGTDPNNTIYALKRAANLICEIAGGKVSSEIVDLYPNKIKDFEVEINFERIFNLLGQKYWHRYHSYNFNCA